MDKERELERELATVLNRYSQENPSNTPDWILAQFLRGCLAAWNTGVQQREGWYGRDPRPGTAGLPDPAEPPMNKKLPAVERKA